MLEDNIELSSATSSVNIRNVKEIEGGSTFLDPGGGGLGVGLGMPIAGRLSHTSSIAVAFEKDTSATEVKEVEILV